MRIYPHFWSARGGGKSRPVPNLASGTLPGELTSDLSACKQTTYDDPDAEMCNALHPESVTRYMRNAPALRY